jgi:cobalt-zinc-cadmium resistance protein CzcA
MSLRFDFAEIPNSLDEYRQTALGNRPDLRAAMQAVDKAKTDYRLFVDLKPKARWWPVFHQNKNELIAAMNRQLERVPGATWSFSQPIQDDMDEAVSGVKGELAVKVYGDDLKILEAKGDEIVGVMRSIQGITDPGLLRVIGQPNLNVVVDRDAAARYQINVVDIQDAVQTAVGGNAVGRVLRGEQRYDLIVRYLPYYRDTKEAIENIRLLALSGERVSLVQLCTVRIADGASQLYREGNHATLPSSTASAVATWAAPWSRPSARLTGT